MQRHTRDAEHETYSTSGRQRKAERSLRQAVAEALEPRKLLVADTGSGLDLAYATPDFFVDFDADVFASIDDGDVMLENLTAGWATQFASEGLDVTQPAGQQTGPWRVELESSNHRAAETTELPADGNYEITLFGNRIEDAGGTLLGGRIRLNDPTEFFFYNADFNGDRKVDIGDFGVLRSGMDNAGSTFAEGDANGDGAVDLADFGIMRDRFGTSLAAPPVAGDISPAGGTTSSVGLTWLQPLVDDGQGGTMADDYDGFHVYRGSPGQDPVLVRTLRKSDRDQPGGYTLNDDQVSYYDTGLVDGIRYSYFTRPFSDTNGNGTATEEVKVPTVLKSVTDLSISDAGGSLTLSWLPGSTSHTYVRIEYVDPGGEIAMHTVLAGAGNSFTVPASHYAAALGSTFLVTAVNDDSEGAPLESAPAVVGPVQGGVTATGPDVARLNEPYSISFNYGGSASNVAFWNVFWGDGNTSSIEDLADMTSGSAEHTFDAITPQNTIAVAAFDALGQPIATAYHNIEILPAGDGDDRNILGPSLLVEGDSATYTAGDQFDGIPDAELVWNVYDETNEIVATSLGQSITLNELGDGTKTITLLRFPPSGSGRVLATRDITVINAPPTNLTISGETNLRANRFAVFSASAFDAGGDDLTYTWTFSYTDHNGDIATITDEGENIRFVVPNNDAIGFGPPPDDEFADATLTVVADDGDGGVVEQVTAAVILPEQPHQAFSWTPLNDASTLAEGQAISPLPDGSYLYASGFANYDLSSARYNQARRHLIGRLLPDLSVDDTFGDNLSLGGDHQPLLGGFSTFLGESVSAPGVFGGPDVLTASIFDLVGIGYNDFNPRSGYRRPAFVGTSSGPLLITSALEIQSNTLFGTPSQHFSSPTALRFDESGHVDTSFDGNATSSSQWLSKQLALTYPLDNIHRASDFSSLAADRAVVHADNSVTIVARSSPHWKGQVDLEQQTDSLAVLRIREDGSRDSSFGVDQHALASSGGAGATIIRDTDAGALSGGTVTQNGTAVAGLHELPDGRLIVIASSFRENEFLPRSDASDPFKVGVHANVTRLTSDGRLDTTFGPNGSGMNSYFALAATDYLGYEGFDVFEALTDSIRLQDGSILALGQITTPAVSSPSGDSFPDRQDLLLMKLQPDGELDQSWATNGFLRLDLLSVFGDAGLPVGSFDAAVGTVIRELPDGSVLVGGHLTTYYGADAAEAFVLKLTADGVASGSGSAASTYVDASFEDDGVFVLPIPSNPAEDNRLGDRPVLRTVIHDILIEDDAWVIAGALGRPSIPTGTEVKDVDPFFARYRPDSLAGVRLTATALEPRRVELHWVDTSYGEEGFLVERAEVPADTTTIDPLALNFETIGHAVADAESYTDLTAEPDTWYAYRVVSYKYKAGADNDELTADSNVAAVTTPAFGLTYVYDQTVLVDEFGVEATSTPLGAGANYLFQATGNIGLGGSAGSGGGGDLFDVDSEYGVWPWTPGERHKTSDYSGATLDYGIAVGLPEAVAGEGTRWRGFLDNKYPFWGEPSTDTPHTYEVYYTHHETTDSAAVFQFRDDYYYDNNIPTGDRYRELGVDIFKGVPGAPARLEARAGEGKTVDVTWEPVSPGHVSGYRLERSIDGGTTFSVAALLPDGARSFTDADVEWNTPYVYRIRSVLEHGFSSWSNLATAVAANLAPRINPHATPHFFVGSQSATNEAVTVTFDIAATDPDGDDEGLTFAVIGGGPDPSGFGPFFDSATDSTLSWKARPFLEFGDGPTQSRLMERREIVRISVTDEDGQVAEAAFDVVFLRSREEFIAINASTGVVRQEGGLHYIDLYVDATIGEPTDADSTDGLTYEWSVVDVPALGQSLFVDNQLGLGRTATALATAGGPHTFRVAVSHPNLETVFSDVVVDVPQTASLIEIRPPLGVSPEEFSDPGIAKASSVPLLGVFSDQFGHLFAPGDATWDVLNSSGLSISGQPGLPEITPAGHSRSALLDVGTTPGDYKVVVTRDNVTEALAFTVNTNDNQPPVIHDVLAHYANDRLTLTADASDPDIGNGLTYDWTVTPDGQSALPTPSWNGTSAARTIVLENVQGAGDYGIALSVSDGSESVPWTETFNIAPVATSLNLDVGVGSTTQSDPLLITAQVLDQFGEPIANPGVTLDWSILNTSFATLSVPGGPNPDPLTREFTSIANGYARIQIKDDTNPDLGHAWAVVSVFDQVDPIARILSLPGGHEPTLIESEVDIDAIVQDVNLNDNLQYNLFLEPFGQIGGNSLLEGNGRFGQLPNTGERMTSLDPASLANGFYNVVLEVDDGHTIVTDSRPIEIRSLVKTGGLNLSFVDLTLDIPGGPPVEVIRTYDSLDAHVDLDFGGGWNVGFAEAQIITDGVRHGSAGDMGTELREFSRVMIDVPGVGPRHFEFRAIPAGYQATNPGVYHNFRPQFIAIDGSDATLELPIENTVTTNEDLLTPDDEAYHDTDTDNSDRFTNGYFLLRSEGLYLQGGNGYDPTTTLAGNRFYLTTADGTRYELEASSGKILERRDAEGNVVEFDNNSVTAPDGQKLELIAGTAGARLSDADGNTVRQVDYLRDQNGRLAQVDAPAGPSTITYDSNGRLLTISDGRDIPVITANYKDDGSLDSVTDARSNTTRQSESGYGGSLGSTGSTSASGSETEYVYDDFGGVIREIRSERDSSTDDVLRYHVTVRKFEYSTDANFLPEEGHGTSGVGKPHEIVEYESFTVSGPDRFGRRYTKLPERVLRITNSYNYTDEKPAILDPDLWRPSMQRVLAADGMSFRTTHFAPGDTINTAYHETGGVRRSVDAFGRVTVNEYDDAGNLLWTRDHLGNVTWNEYTPEGNPEGLPVGLLVRTWTVDEQGNELQTLSQNTYYFDQDPTDNDPDPNHGRLKTSTDAAGVTTHYEYTADGQVERSWRTWTGGGTTQADPDSRTEFDEAGRAIRTFDADGNVSHTFFGPSGLAIATVDEFNGNLADSPATVTVHDAAGRAVATFGPGGGGGVETRTVFDADGRVAFRSEPFDSDTSFNLGLTSPATLTTIAADNTATYVVTKTLYDDLGRSVGTERYADSRIDLISDRDHPTVDDLFKTDIGNVVLGTLISSTRTVYDDRGRTVEQVNADGLRTGTVYWFDGSVRATGPLLPDAPADWHIDPVFHDPNAAFGAFDTALLLYFRNAPSDGNDLTSTDNRADVSQTFVDRWNLNVIEISGQIERDQQPNPSSTLDTFYLRFEDPIAPTTPVDISVSLYGLSEPNGPVAAIRNELVTAINGGPESAGDTFNIRAIADPTSSGRILLFADDPMQPVSYVLHARVDDGGSGHKLDPPTIRLGGDVRDIVEVVPGDPQLDVVHASAFRRSTLSLDPLGRRTLVVTDEQPGLGTETRTVHADGTVTRVFEGLTGRAASVPSELMPDTPAEVGTLLSGDAKGGRHVVSFARFDPDSTDPAEDPQATHEVYDASGRLLSVWRPAVVDPADGVTKRPRYQYTYDAVGNGRTQVDPLSRTTVFHADERGRTTGRTLPLGTAVFDIHGDLDPAASTFTEATTYDDRGRVATTIAFDGVITEYVYDDETFDPDVDGSALDWPTDNGTVLPLGRMVEERVFAAGKTPGVDTPDLVHRYAYDDLGRRTAWGRWLGSNLDLPIDRLETWTHDPVTGNVSGHDQPEGHVFYEHDPATGRLIALDAPGQAADATYHYDDQGRLSRIDLHGHSVTYAYDAAGQRLREDHGGSAVHVRTFDDLGQLLTLEVTAGGGAGTLLSQTYTYEGDGQRQSVTESGSASTAGTTTWTYDPIGRLIAEDLNGTLTSWQYDLANNRVEQNADGTVTLYTVDDNDRLVSTNTGGATTAYTYDDAGRQTFINAPGTDPDTHYDWNLLGQLVRVDQDADTNANGDPIDSTWDTEFEYNAAGRRAIETDVSTGTPGDVTTRLFDNQSLTGHSQLLFEDAPGLSDDRHHAFADRLLGQSTQDAFVNPLLLDGHSGVRALLTRSGGLVESYSYDAHGTLASGSSFKADGTLLGTVGVDDAESTHLSDAERWSQATGTYDHRRRDQIDGRWLSIDSYLPGPGELWDANLHVFVGGDPINKVDPSGMSFSITGILTSTAGISALLLLSSPNVANAPSQQDIASGNVFGDKSGDLAFNGLLSAALIPPVVVAGKITSAVSQQLFFQRPTAVYSVKYATGATTIAGRSRQHGTFFTRTQGPLEYSDAVTFSGGRYAAVDLSQDITVFRAWGGRSRELGSFWSFQPPRGSMQAQIDNALLPQWGNTVENWTSINIPSGTRVYVGEAATQGGFFAGGGSQVFLPSDVARKTWINGTGSLR